MSEADIRQQIYTIVSGISNIGKVYDYERWAADWTAFINLFKATIGGVEQIRGWEISRKSASEKQIVIKTVGASQMFEDSHVYAIKGYLRVNDSEASEKVFNLLIENIKSAFRENRNLNGKAQRHDLIQAPLIETRIFGDVLCHCAELNLTVYERL